MRIILVCLLVVASVTALDQPSPAQLQAQGKRASFPQADDPAPPQPPPAGYSSSGVATLPQGQGAAFPEAALLSEAQQQAAISKTVYVNQNAGSPVAPPPPAPPAPSAGGLSSEAFERIEQKSNIIEQTSNSIDEHVEIPIPTPYPISYDNKISKSFVSAPQTVQVQVPSQAYSFPQSVSYAAPQQYSVPIPLTFPPQSYPALQFQAPSAPLISQYSFANSQQFTVPSAPQQTQFKTVIPTPAPLVKQPIPQLKTVVPTTVPAVSVKNVAVAPAPQPLYIKSAPLAPQIYYNGAPTNYVNLPTVYSTAKPVVAGPAISLHQPAFNLAQPAFSLPQPAFNLAQPAFNFAQPAFSLPQSAISLPAFSLPQPSISLQQPIFSAKQLNVELSPLSPTTVAPVHFEAVPTALPLTINTATPAPLHIAHNFVSPTPAPLHIAHNFVSSTPAPIAVHSSYDGPSHAYLPPENFLQKK